MSARARAESADEHRRLVEEMSLLQLRKARELTQTKIAGELNMGQGDVSKLETAHGHVREYAGELSSGRRSRSGNSRGIP